MTKYSGLTDVEALIRKRTELGWLRLTGRPWILLIRTKVWLPSFRSALLIALALPAILNQVQKTIQWKKMTHALNQKDFYCFQSGLGFFFCFLLAQIFQFNLSLLTSTNQKNVCFSNPPEIMPSEFTKVIKCHKFMMSNICWHGQKPLFGVAHGLHLHGCWQSIQVGCSCWPANTFKELGIPCAGVLAYFQIHWDVSQATCVFSVSL